MRNSKIERNFFNIPTDRTINIKRNLKNYSSNNIFDNNNIKIHQKPNITNSKTEMQNYYSNFPSIINLKNLSNQYNTSRQIKKFNMKENLKKFKIIDNKINNIYHEEEKILPRIEDVKNIINNNQNELYYDLKKKVNDKTISYEENNLNKFKDLNYIEDNDRIKHKKKIILRNNSNFNYLTLNNNNNQEYINIVKNIESMRKNLNLQFDNLYQNSIKNYENLKELLLRNTKGKNLINLTKKNYNTDENKKNINNDNISYNINLNLRYNNINLNRDNNNIINSNNEDINKENEKKENQRKSIFIMSKKLNKLLKLNKNTNKNIIQHNKKLDLYEKEKLHNKKLLKKIEEKLLSFNKKNKNNFLKPKNKFRSYIYYIIAARRIMNIQYFIYKELKYKIVSYYIENVEDMDLILKKLVFYSIKNIYEEIIINNDINLNLIIEKNSKKKQEIYFNLQNYLENIIQGLNKNFFDGTSKQMLKYLSIYITNYSYIPSDFFTMFELVRINILQTGEIINLNDNQRIMILGFYIIIKIMLRYLFLEMNFHKYLIQNLTKKIKLNIKIIVSVIYRGLINLFKNECEIKREIDEIENNIDTTNFMKVIYEKKEFIFEKKHRHYLKESLTSLNNHINKKERIEQLNSNNDNEINISNKKKKKKKNIRLIKIEKKKSNLKLSSVEEFNKIKNDNNNNITKDLGFNDLNNNFENISIKTNSNIAHRNKVKISNQNLNVDNLKENKSIIKNFSEIEIEEMENIIENIQTFGDDVEIYDVYLFDNVLYNDMDLEDYYKFAEKNNFDPITDIKNFIIRVINMIYANF